MEQDFIEEKERLAQTEAELGQIADSYNAQADAINKDYLAFEVYDRDDYAKKAELYDQMRQRQDARDLFLSYMPSPYFGRMDVLTANGEAKTYYIGKRPIQHNDKTMVIDWRDSMGTAFNGNQSHFAVKGEVYDLTLKRQITVENKELTDVVTTYSGINAFSDDMIVDSFLLKVLQDKRRTRAFTDIIRTIQANQNEIIRLPADRSFAVQGCAGSGKTMILLHRLSVMFYNNADMKVDSARILTPNEFFDSHIDGLSKELSIDRIPRSTVADFYKELILRYPGENRYKNKVESELNLNTGLLKKIYSSAFERDAREKYHAVWAEEVQSMADANCDQVFAAYNDGYRPSRLQPADQHNSSAYTMLRQSVERIKGQVDTTLSEFTQNAERKASLERRAAEMEEDYARLQLQIEQLKGSANEALENRITEIETDEEAEQSALTSAADVVSAADTELVTLRQQEQLEASKPQPWDNPEAYLNPASVIAIKDDAADRIRAELGTELASIAELGQKLSKIPSYAFTRANAVKKDIQEATEGYAAKAKAILADMTGGESEELKQIRASIHTKEAERARAEADKAEHQTKIDACDSALDGLDGLARVLELPNFNMSYLANQTDPVVTQFIADHNAAFTALSNAVQNAEDNRKDAQLCADRLKECERISASFSDNFATEQVQHALDVMQHAVERLNFENIRKELPVKMLSDLYVEFDIPRNTGKLYRHRLYLNLLFLSYYYPTISMKREAYVHIDEAQDIGVMEYHLLRNILGKHCIFNLYGDVNQLVYDYKEFEDWPDIDFITDGNLFVLNENYRNTLQITEYCNKVLNAGLTPIGITGEEVTEAGIYETLSQVKVRHAAMPDERVAVLLVDENKAAAEILRAELPEDIAVFDAVDDAKISVVNVETAKGLEFETVVAITGKMGFSEKYIALTRALNKLFVVKQESYAKPVNDNDQGGEEVTEEQPVEEPVQNDAGDTPAETSDEVSEDKTEEASDDTEEEPSDENSDDTLEEPSNENSGDTTEEKADDNTGSETVAQPIKQPVKQPDPVPAHKPAIMLKVEEALANASLSYTSNDKKQIIVHEVTFNDKQQLRLTCAKLGMALPPKFKIDKERVWIFNFNYVND